MLAFQVVAFIVAACIAVAMIALPFVILYQLLRPKGYARWRKR